MYHIKNDKRCLKSAARIAEAFRDMLAKKPLPEITVTDLQKASGIGRSTFYRLFDNTDDVLLYLAEEEFNGLMALYREMNWSDFTRHFITSIMSEEQGLLNVAYAGKTHLISKALRNKLTLEAEADRYKFDNISKYMIAMFVGGCISLVTAWNENGRKESVEELARLMQQAFNYSKIENQLRRPAKG